MVLKNKTLDFKLVTPRGVMFEGVITKLNAKNSFGGIAILPNHAEIKSNIVPCTMEICLSDCGTRIYYELGDGLLEASPGKVTVMASFAKETDKKELFSL